MLRTTVAAATAFALMAFGSAAQAGPHSEALAQCLAKTTTARDKDTLVLWIYSAMGDHPALKPYQRMTKAEQDVAAKSAADLMVRLMTVDCRKETVSVIAHEGMNAFGAAFKGFGEVAGTALMAHPDVEAGMGRISRSLDDSQFEGLQKDLTAEMMK